MPGCPSQWTISTKLFKPITTNAPTLNLTRLSGDGRAACRRQGSKAAISPQKWLTFISLKKTALCAAPKAGCSTWLRLQNWLRRGSSLRRRCRFYRKPMFFCCPTWWSILESGCCQLNFPRDNGLGSHRPPSWEIAQLGALWTVPHT